MVVRVVWTERSIGDLEDIRSYVASDRPRAATRLATRLFNAGQSLEHFPRRGRPIGDNWRELTSVRPYLIRYRIRDDVVEILTIRHGARRLDPVHLTSGPDT
ncbi:MAG: type II toxin-antitoxin system RelE/ParE family toxin [Pseudomonadota bacterium]